MSWSRENLIIPPLCSFSMLVVVPFLGFFFLLSILSSKFFDKLIFRPLKWPPGVLDGTGRGADDSGVTGSATADEKKKSNLKKLPKF